MGVVPAGEDREPDEVQHPRLWRGWRRRDPDAWSGMPWAVVSVPVWRFESQMAKVLEKFRFKGEISKMA